MIDSFKPGQTVRCTIIKAPRTEDRIQTIERLMRRDGQARRALRRGHMLRQRHMVTYNRGNREWFKRAKSSHVVRVAAGETWTMPWTVDILGDIGTVKAYLKIENA